MVKTWRLELHWQPYSVMVMSTMSVPAADAEAHFAEVSLVDAVAVTAGAIVQ